jgi:MFS family permease
MATIFTHWHPLLWTFFGAIIAGDLADHIGRRWTIISGCLTFIVDCILEVASTGLALMTVGRLIAGAGVGFISAISKFNTPYLRYIADRV